MVWPQASFIAVEVIAVEVNALELTALELIAIELIVVEVNAVEVIAVESIAVEVIAAGLMAVELMGSEHLDGPNDRQLVHQRVKGDPYAALYMQLLNPSLHTNTSPTPLKGKAQSR